MSNGTSDLETKVLEQAQQIDQLRDEVEMLRKDLLKSRASERERCIQTIRTCVINEKPRDIREEFAWAIDLLRYMP